MIVSKCITCQHEHICKYKDEYDKVIKDINVTVPEPFTLALTCSHYYNAQCYLGSYNGYSNHTTNCSASEAEGLNRLPAGADTFTY